MPTANPPQKFEFQAEIRQLLDIVINSLYTEKEIFLRELVSNAADALEKMRRLQITEKEIADPDASLEIRITTDENAKTIEIEDSGVGMSRDELIENLGTIAHSGSRAFLQTLGQADNVGGSALIGKFGVGFYSAFMVAKTVRVHSRSYRPDEGAQIWSCEGDGEYRIEKGEEARRGCRIVLELNDACAEFAKEWRAKEILQRYSSFVPFPIHLNGKHINSVQAIWAKQRSEISESEYTEFYKFQASAYNDPLLRLHFTADAPLSISALFFVPKDNPEKLGMGRTPPGVALYSRKVLIEQKPKALLPDWLRFLKGVVDCEDLPLNISRETSQDRRLMEKLGRILTNRFLKFLEDEAESRPESYATFYREFASFLKEGAFMDASYRETLAKLFRYESTRTEPGKQTSLSKYISRMAPDQKDIYFLTGPNRETIEAGPYLEGFRQRNLEVLFCCDPSDEYVLNHVREFSEHRLVAADSAALNLPEAAPPANEPLGEEELAKLIAWMKEKLDGRVSDIKVSQRLVESPAVALNPNPFMALHLRRQTKSLIREGSETPPRVNLEVNPRHELMRSLSHKITADPERASLVVEQIFDNALMAAGLLSNTTKMVNRLYRILQYL